MLELTARTRNQLEQTLETNGFTTGVTIKIQSPIIQSRTTATLVLASLPARVNIVYCAREMK